jgi:hypothetical protein
LAQGLLESDWGRSDLAIAANNHFGIKCSNDWLGQEYYKQDDDYLADGTLAYSCFRKFSTAEESYAEHTKFLTDPRKRKRYGFLFDYGADYKAWAEGLKNSGYATDPEYPKKLILIIEKYKLFELDSGLLFNSSTITNIQLEDKENHPNTIEEVLADDVSISKKADRIKRNIDNKEKEEMLPRRVKMTSDIINDVKCVRLSELMDLASLSRSLGISIKDIITFNEIIKYEQDIIAAGSIIYIEKKKRDFMGTQEFHKVAANETIESISQLYGIRAQSLYVLNRLEKDETPIKGEKLSLRHKIKKENKPKVEKRAKHKKDILFE